MKGAFNRVVIDILINKLRKSHISKQLISVIQDLILNKKASIIINGKDLEITNLQHTELS